MSTEAQWKKKYFDALAEIDTKEQRLRLAEETVRKSVSRLSLISDQTDQTLEKQLEKIRALARKTPNHAQILNLLKDIDLSIKRMEIERSAGKWHQLPRNELLARILEDIDFSAELEKRAARLSKQLKKTNAHFELQEHIQELLSLIKTHMDLYGAGADDNAGSRAPALAPKEQSKAPNLATFADALMLQISKNLSTDLDTKQLHTEILNAETEAELSQTIARLVGLFAESGSGEDDDVSFANDKDRYANSRRENQPSEDSEDSVDTPEQRIGELLTYLNLPAELLPELAKIQKQLERKVPRRHWPKILTDIADLIAKIRTELESEKAELQRFLVQITAELKTIDSTLTSTQESQAASFESGEYLDKKMQSNLSLLQTSVSEATDLESLRQVINQRVESISAHLKEHRESENERQKKISKEFSALKTRISSMESETVSLNKKLENERSQARTDALTGVANRLAYEQKLNEDFRDWTAGVTGLSVIVCDVDHFKKLNDSCGHQAGDKALQSIATVLQKNLRGTDMLARYGGEEFVVLVRHSLEAQENIAEKIAEHLRQAVESADFRFEGKKLPVTISCGYARFCDGDSINEPFARADKALYKAKRAGRNCVRGTQNKSRDLREILGL